MPNNQPDWEKEFKNKMKTEWYKIETLEIGEIIDFIRSLLKSKREIDYAEGYEKALADYKTMDRTFLSLERAKEIRAEERNRLLEEVKLKKKIEDSNFNGFPRGKIVGYNQAIKDLEELKKGLRG